MKSGPGKQRDLQMINDFVTSSQIILKTRLINTLIERLEALCNLGTLLCSRLPVIFGFSTLTLLRLRVQRTLRIAHLRAYSRG